MSVSKRFHDFIDIIEMKKRPKRICLKDIADKVGVSTALVSYVLNGQENEKRVGSEAAKRIRTVAQELGYNPNQIARSLRKGTTKTIGLIVADIANTFFSLMARIIEDEANIYGYTVIMGSSDEDFENTSILVETLMNRQVDGFIIVPCDGSADYLKKLVENNIPLVQIDRYIPGISANYVVLDNYNATFEATNHLINKGHNKIGMVAYKTSLCHMKERIRGYTTAMETVGLKRNISVKEVRHSYIDNDIKKVLLEFTREGKKVDALLFATNALSIRGLYFINENKIKVPNELAIIGFDGNEAFDFFYAPLTYILQPIEEMAKKSVSILMDQINGSNKIENIKMRHQIIYRQSC